MHEYLRNIFPKHLICAIGHWDTCTDRCRSALQCVRIKYTEFVDSDVFDIDVTYADMCSVHFQVCVAKEGSEYP